MGGGVWGQGLILKPYYWGGLMETCPLRPPLRRTSLYKSVSSSSSVRVYVFIKITYTVQCESSFKENESITRSHGPMYHGHFLLLLSHCVCL